MRSLYVVQTMELFARQQLAGLAWDARLTCSAGLATSLCVPRRTADVGQSGMQARVVMPQAMPSPYRTSLSVACCESLLPEEPHIF
jgi:hypothetical protein